MRPLEVVARTFTYRAPDGRIVFRPWGARGPCYLLSEGQRTARACVQAGYYALMLGAIYWGTLHLGTLRTFALVLPATLLGNYLLFWLFARGLPSTEPPPKPDAAYLREQLRAGNRAFGKPYLWLMLVLSLGLSILGIWAGAYAGAWGVGIGSALFFGTGVLLFAWQLRNQ